MDEEGAAETVGNHLKKLDRKMDETDHYWETLVNAQADPKFQPKIVQSLERVPSEKKEKRMPRIPRKR